VSLKGKKGTKGRKEEKDIEVEEGGVVDAVVCCLSLMGTDWVGMIREARRVLVNGYVLGFLTLPDRTLILFGTRRGQLKIAEVASRFVDLDQFVKCIEEVGFESVSKVSPLPSPSHCSYSRLDSLLTFISQDTTNTHFVMLDFVRTTSGEFLPREKNAITAKAKDLLRPCVYKKR
jgi:ribosomal RNA-processing protein 8